MSVSRVVALLTPVFAALAGYVATQAARLPGAPALSRDELTALFVAGALSATTAAVKWLDGRARHERQAADEAQERDRWAVYESDRGEPEEGGDADEEPFSVEQLSDMQDELNRLRQERDVALRADWLEAEIRRTSAGMSTAVGALSERLDALEASPVPWRPEGSQ